MAPGLGLSINQVLEHQFIRVELQIMLVTV